MKDHPGHVDHGNGECARGSSTHTAPGGRCQVSVHVGQHTEPAQEQILQGIQSRMAAPAPGPSRDSWWHQPTKWSSPGGGRTFLQPHLPHGHSPPCCHRPGVSFSPARFAKLLKGKRWEPAPRPRPPEPCPKEPGDERVPLFAGGGGKPKIAARPNSRKAKSPAPGLSSGERPPSVSSVHSEGDCNRRTPLTNRVWEDRPSSAGRTRGDSSQSGRATSQGLGRLQGDGGAATAGADSLFAPPAGSTPFPYNPLTMRLPSGVVTATPSAPLPQGTPGSQHHAWDEEPKPLLCSQYETLSDSE